MQIAFIATEMYSRICVLIHLLECIPIPITVRVLFGIIFFWCWVAITKFLSESAKLRATRALVLSCVFSSPLDSYPMCPLTLWTQFPYVSLVHLITGTLYANIFYHLFALEFHGSRPYFSVCVLLLIYLENLLNIYIFSNLVSNNSNKSYCQLILIPI